jgi:DNA topoisomerase I
VLDLIANGEQDRVAALRRFYFGDGGSEDFPGLHPLVTGLGEIDARMNATFPVPDTDVVVRVGKYGAFLERGEERVSLPDDLAPDELTPVKVADLMAHAGDRELGQAPDNGRTVQVKSGRFGPYVTELLTSAEEELTGRKRPKPRTASLLKTMSPDTVTLADAVRLLSLPRTVGVHPESGEPITAHNGRYGPYLMHSGDSRSLPDEESIFSINVDEALALLAQPKQRGRRAADPGVVVGTDPNSGGEIRLKTGRFGPYVTDGETNASLRTGDAPESLTLERAVELLAIRRAAGPPKKRARKAPAKKAPAKKSTTKKTTAKKTTTKKTTTKKATSSRAKASTSVE